MEDSACTGDFMDFNEGKKYFMQGLEILKLNAKTAEGVAKDEKATGYAIIFVLIAGLTQAIGTFNLPGLVALPITTLVISFFGIGILHVLAKLFGGTAAFMEFYRTMGVGYVGVWIAVIPFLGPILMGLVGLWYLVVHVVVLKAVHKLTTGKAIVVVAIPLVIAIILAVIVATLMAALFATMIAGMGLAGLENMY